MTKQDIINKAAQYAYIPNDQWNMDISWEVTDLEDIEELAEYIEAQFKEQAERYEMDIHYLEKQLEER